MSLKTVITVPHAACPPETGGRHLCDRTAPEAARKLHEALPGSRLIVSEVHRDPNQIASDGSPGSDMNRPNARRSAKFQRSLDDALATRPDILVDVHSFPDGAFGDAPEIVVLDPNEGFGWDGASHSLVVYLKAIGVAAQLVRGGVENAIVVRARAAGASAVLVEFSEAMSPTAVDRAVEAIAMWALEITSSVHEL
jgi:hypothetical protein